MFDKLSTDRIVPRAERIDVGSGELHGIRCAFVTFLVGEDKSDPRIRQNTGSGGFWNEIGADKVKKSIVVTFLDMESGVIYNHRS